MNLISLQDDLRSNSYPGRGIIMGKTPDGTKAVAAYFIMGRSENSRNRVFVEDGEGIRTQALLFTPRCGSWEIKPLSQTEIRPTPSMREWISS